MTLDDWQRRVAELIALGQEVLKTAHGSYGFEYVDNQRYAEFRSAALSFLRNSYGDLHPYYTEFNTNVRVNRPDETQQGVGILKGVQREMAGGWLHTAKGLVSAEIFSDFLEMADHLMSEAYKDAAAVMIGSVLEEHLRQLCAKVGMEVVVSKGGRHVPKTADLLNADLAKANVYNKLDQKQITAWLDLRNNAAHGHYDQYDIAQVRGMLSGVTNFMARVTT
jgi:hypothetical protein